MPNLQIIYTFIFIRLMCTTFFLSYLPYLHFLLFDYFLVAFRKTILKAKKLN